MRGNLTDQDLTDYALNELDPAQRLYVESMLAVSVECRNDVYEMLDLAQMLEEGFERDSSRTIPAMLTPEQRIRLTTPRRKRAAVVLLSKAAAITAMAASVAFVIANPQLWKENESARKVAEVGSQVTQIVSQTVLPAGDEVDISQFVSIDSLPDDSSDWLKVNSEALPDPGVVCTPPSWLENVDLSDLH